MQSYGIGFCISIICIRLGQLVKNKNMKGIHETKIQTFENNAYIFQERINCKVLQCPGLYFNISLIFSVALGGIKKQ